MASSQFSAEEIKAIGKYQAEAYVLNELLRKGADTSHWRMHIGLLDAAIAKNKWSCPVTLYRASFLKDVEQFVTTEDKIRYFRSPTYLSTTIAKYRTTGNEVHSMVARHFNSLNGYGGSNAPVLLTIHCPVGYELAPIYQVQDSFELQVLIGRDRRFVVLEEKQDISRMLPRIFDDSIPEGCKQLFHYELLAMGD